VSNSSSCGQRRIELIEAYETILIGCSCEVIIEIRSPIFRSKTVYDFTVKDRKGKDVSLKEYANEASASSS